MKSETRWHLAMVKAAPGPLGRVYKQEERGQLRAGRSGTAQGAAGSHLEPCTAPSPAPGHGNLRS